MSVNICIKCKAPIQSGLAYCNKCKPKKTDQVTIIKPTIDETISMEIKPIPKELLTKSINHKWEKMQGIIPEDKRNKLLSLGYVSDPGWHLDGIIVRCPSCYKLKTVHTIKSAKCEKCGKQFQVTPKRTHMDEIIMAIPQGKLSILHDIMKYSRR